jgi:uncharacterized membrane protein
MGDVCMELYSMLVSLHGLAGAIALPTFWLAALARKGSPLHRRSGQIYLLAMIAIMLTAVPMAGYFFARSRPGTAIFLLYLVLITLSSCWLGWRAIQRKATQAGFRDSRYLVLAVCNGLGGLLVAGYGVWQGQVLMMGFSLIGIGLAVSMWRRRVQPLPTPRWWIREHLGAMLGAGAATHVAFLSIGLGRVLQWLGLETTPTLGILPWFVPVLVSTAAAIWLDRRYAPRGDSALNAPLRQVADPATPGGGR